MKISGACTLSHEPFPYKDIWDPLARIFDAFGFDRCMWGTDWTRAVGMLTYEQGVEAFRVTDRLSDSDRAALMGETLQRVYNLDDAASLTGPIWHPGVPWHLSCHASQLLAAGCGGCRGAETAGCGRTEA